MKDPIVWVAFLLIMAIGGCAYWITSKHEKACEAKGGVWYQPYKSSGICLRPGTVVMP